GRHGTAARAARRRDRAGRGGAVRHPPARGPRCAGGEGRAAGRRGLRPRLRPGGARAVQPLRLAQPRQGERGAGPEGPCGARRARRPARPRRRRGAEPRPRGRRPPRRHRRRPGGPVPAAGGLRRLRVRRRWPVLRPQGLRPADPVRGRAGLGDRHPGRAGEGRHLGGRHRRRHVRAHRRARRPARARPDGPGPGAGGVDAGGAGGVDGLPLPLRAVGHRAAARRGEPLHDRPVRPGPHRHRGGGERRAAERAGVGGVLRHRAAPSRAGRRPPLRGQRGPGGAPRRAGRARRRGVRRAGPGGRAGAPGRRRHRPRPAAHDGRVRRAPAARRPRPLARGGDGGGTGALARAAGDRGLARAHRRRPGGRGAHGRGPRRAGARM
ncbi:MAG: putative CAIB/BAIF-family enzyme, partial [uncultured Pseudonocardia sp.]